ncbi:DUF4288 domain-containing protein [Delftia sp. NA_296.1]|jgi:hypothetical protein|uniref:DUF4288 domain-containing protein n=1 Tax=Chryseobacterium sp. B5 TaxID=2050562 RepID=A0A2G7T8V4_9FLAO|nr:MULTISPECIES: DUF4288 domain-containing protein [Delftia]KLO58243.1 hypothetical protein AA671_17795 [Delftia tsuruhatensis]PJO37798.1 DUF4288 domain-containing protein [Delftia acidovorans]ROQ92662.1 uncharacterized protein DUF4288 [Delftia acidovorans]
MKHEKNISPVGWYVVSYLLRFVELNDEKRDDEQARFLSWENTVLVRAGTLDEAYEKGMALALENAVPYKGGPDGEPVQWELLGITEVLPIYEELADGAEILWTERAPRKLRNLRQMVKPKGEFRQ